MNKTPKLTMILALVGGLALANASIGQSFAYTASAEKTMFGHFTLIVKDEFGNIKDYIEVDNTITDEGDGCIANLTFGDATNVLSSCGGGKISAIGVSDCDGAGTTDTGNTDCGNAITTPHDDTTTLFDDNTDATSDDIGDECDDETSDASDFSATYTARVGATPAKARLTSIFTVSEVDASGLVKEAGILNGCADTDQLFAIKAFSTVTLTGSDTLTVNYDVSFSG